MGSTIDEVYLRYRYACSGLKKQQTLDHTRTAIRLLEDFLSETGRSSRMMDFTVQDAEAWRAWMVRADRWLASTINSYLRSAAPVFRWASRGRNRAIEENPFQSIEYLTEEHEVMEFTRDEIQAMLEKANVLWQGLIILAAVSGLTRSEGQNSTWRDIVYGTHPVTGEPISRIWVRKKEYDPEFGGTWEWIPKRRGKERRPVLLPLSPKMRPILDQLQFARHGDNPYIFVPFERYCDLRAKGTLSEDERNCPLTNFNRNFDELLEAADVPKIVRGNRRYFHHLRCTAVTSWTRLIGKVPDFAPQDVQALARHSSLKTTMRYMALNPAAAAAVEGHSILDE